MPETTDEIRAAVMQRFSRVARSPEQEQKFPVGPANTKAGVPCPLRRRWKEARADGSTSAAGFGYP